MQHRTLNRLVAVVVFIISLGTYLSSLPPTVVFWDVGEHCASSFLLQVQHPPGSPLLVLVMRVASMIPYATDIAVRMHFVNTLASTFVITLLYLTVVRLILLFRPVPTSLYDRIAVYGSAALAALSLTFSTTFWFNSIEVETRNISLLFTALIIWLVLLWREKAEELHSDKFLLMITFLVGLTVGVHIHGLLGFAVAIMIVYFRTYKKSLRQFLFSTDVLKFGVVASLIFWSAYPGIVKWFPSMLDQNVFGIESQLWLVVAAACVIVPAYLAYDSSVKQKRILNIASLGFLLILLGYSTYVTVFIRANADPPINENNPSNLKRLVSYLEREQYGETPLLKRRFSNEPDKIENFKKYSSDLDYMWEYQIKHMYFRYIGWNFIGREGDWQDAGVKWSQLYGIPFLVGLIGFFYHWKKDEKHAFTMTAFFLLTGLVLAVYFNMQEQQPRERDYFFVYSVFAFCIWIGMGMLGIFDFIREKVLQPRSDLVGYAAFALVFLLVPGNMLRTNYHPMSRTGHYLAFDYSYNLLQSTEKDAVLFTNGDNDTFPLWYLQAVEGVRRDVRIINLSLANTDWYIMQLKHSEPYGARKVAVSIPDGRIETIQPIAYEPQYMQLPVPRSALPGWNPSKEDPRGSAIVDTVKFLMPATLQFGNVKALRVQDILVYDVVRSTGWSRPIYFASTVGEDGKIGLRDYLEFRGLAFKLVPKRIGSYWAGLNEDVTWKDLFTDVKKVSQEPAFGFLWRGLQDSTVHFDENQRRLVMNYRQVFLTLALYEQNIKHDSLAISSVLDRLDRVVPRRIFSLDYRLKDEIALLYNAAGNRTRFQEYARELITELEPQIASGNVPQTSEDNPYVVLLQLYQGMGEYDKALELLDKIQTVFANAQGVKQFVEGTRAEILALKGRQPSGPTTDKPPSSQ